MSAWTRLNFLCVLETCKTMNKWCREGGGETSLDLLDPSSSHRSEAEGLRETTATTLLDYSSRTEPCWPASLGIGGVSCSYRPPALMPFPRRRRLNGWASSPVSSAELAQEIEGQGQPRRMQEDQAAPSKIQQEEQAPSSSMPPTPGTFIGTSPGQPSWHPLSQQQGSWGGRCLRGSPFLWSPESWEQSPPWEQTTTLVSMRAAEKKEEAQTTSPSPFAAPVPAPVPALILPLLTWTQTKAKPDKLH